MSITDCQFISNLCRGLDYTCAGALAISFGSSDRGSKSGFGNIITLSDLIFQSNKNELLRTGNFYAAALLVDVQQNNGGGRNSLTVRRVSFMDNVILCASMHCSGSAAIRLSGGPGSYNNNNTVLLEDALFLRNRAIPDIIQTQSQAGALLILAEGGSFSPGRHLFLSYNSIELTRCNFTSNSLDDMRNPFSAVSAAAVWLKFFGSVSPVLGVGGLSNKLHF